MAIPVKFYSVTAEEYERIRQEMQEACHVQEQQEAEERRKSELEGGIFFVEERDNHANKGEINKVN